MRWNSLSEFAKYINSLQFHVSQNTAHGTAILSTLRTIAGSISPAIFVSLMTVAGSASPIHGMNAALIGISAIAAMQCIVALFFVGKKEKEQSVSMALNTVAAK